MSSQDLTPPARPAQDAVFRDPQQIVDFAFDDTVDMGDQARVCVEQLVGTFVLAGKPVRGRCLRHSESRTRWIMLEVLLSSTSPSTRTSPP